MSIPRKAFTSRISSDIWPLGFVPNNWIKVTYTSFIGPFAKLTRRAENDVCSTQVDGFSSDLEISTVYISIPVVPHKAVAEASNLENL